MFADDIVFENSMFIVILVITSIDLNLNFNKDSFEFLDLLERFVALLEFDKKEKKKRRKWGTKKESAMK